MDSRRPGPGQVSPLVNCVPWTGDLTSLNTRLPPQSPSCDGVGGKVKRNKSWGNVSQKSEVPFI